MLESVLLLARMSVLDLALVSVLALVRMSVLPLVRLSVDLWASELFDCSCRTTYSCMRA